MRCSICHRGRVYFYPRPPRGGRRLSAWLPCCCSTISIHALREEGDQVPAPVLYSSCIFLSTPSARRATKPGTSWSRSIRFLSTPSARRATGGQIDLILGFQFLSTPSARRATRHSGQRRGQHGISIHALREEGDLLEQVPRLLLNRFLSTPSARRATVSKHVAILYGQISIHALREEGDHSGVVRESPSRISIHALREEGDLPDWLKPFITDISIHALREEGDPRCPLPWPEPSDFYPRPPRGGRRTGYYPQVPQKGISIHALREEGDPMISRRCSQLR